MGIEKYFKTHILNSGGYKGGKPAPKNIEKVYKLSSNENYFGTSGQVSSGLRESIADLNIYTSQTAAPLYKALVAYHNQDFLTEDHFVAGNGGSEIIQIVNQAFLEKGLNSIISSPCFAPYKMFSEWTGGSALDVPLKTPDFTIDVDGILKSIDQNTRLIFLTSPNNPTGTYINKYELKAILNGVPDHVLVVYDEVYHHFVTAGDYSTAEPFVRDGHSIIGINSFSKAFGLAGMRIGYGYSTPSIISYLKKLIRPFLINKLSLEAGVIALSDSSFLDHSVSEVIKAREVLINGIRSIPGISTWNSEGNFILIKTPMDEFLLTDKLMESGIMVRPTSNFGAPGCIRITVGDLESTNKTLGCLATIFTE